MPPEKKFDIQLIFLIPKSHNTALKKLARRMGLDKADVLRMAIRKMETSGIGEWSDEVIRQAVMAAQPQENVTDKIPFGVTSDQNEFVQELARKAAGQEGEDEREIYSIILRYALAQMFDSLDATEKEKIGLAG